MNNEPHTNRTALFKLPECDRVIDSRSLIWDINSAVPAMVEADLRFASGSEQGAVLVHKFGNDPEIYADNDHLDEVEAMSLAMVAAVREIRSIRRLRQQLD